MPRPSDTKARGARPRLTSLARHPLARGVGALAAVLLFSALGARGARLSHADAPLPDPMPALPSPATAPEKTPDRTAPGDAGAAPSNHADGGAARGEDPDLVFVNLATAAELRRLPGVGDKRAAAILALRERLGGFRRAEDLLRVRGVGRKTLARWRPRLRFDRAPAVDDAGAGADAALSSPRP